MIRRLLAVAVCIAAATGSARAQEPYNLTAPVRSLATLFTDLYGPNGLTVDSMATLPGEQPHTAHFNSDFQFNFGQFGTALVSQLVSVPLPSPASGFTYQFDPSLGVFQRTTQSFGPILAARADTIGAGRVSFGFAYQHFTFDTIEGLDLGQVPAVFTHDNAVLRGGREDVVTTENSIEASLNQATTFATLGVTDRFDISIAVPFASTDRKVVSEATIHRLGTSNPLTHFYRQQDGSIGETRLFTAVGSATGIGDVKVRLKDEIVAHPTSSVAVGIDLRLPTGDAMNLLGSGTTGIQPFAVWSSSRGKISPHLNAGYTWNGKSVLSGNPAEGTSADFPDDVTYAAGADMSVNSRLTMAIDVLGRYVIDSERLQAEDFRALDAAGTRFDTVSFTRNSFNELSGAFGMKANVQGRLLIEFNLLFSLDDHGLRDKVTPLVGFNYAF
jgi:hypothetical protein